MLLVMEPGRRGPDPNAADLRALLRGVLPDHALPVRVRTAARGAPGRAGQARPACGGRPVHRGRMTPCSATLPVVLSLALTIYCVVDAIQTDGPAVRNLPKIGWLLLILLFPVVGPAAWLIAGRPQRSAARRPDPAAAVGRPPTRPRHRARPAATPPRGPDDDPDFLKDL